jgi:hypothetical protein
VAVISKNERAAAFTLGGFSSASVSTKSGVHDDVKAKSFEKRFGINLTSKFRHVPESFARLLAKIAY